MGARRRNVLAGLLLTLTLTSSADAAKYVDYKDVPAYSSLAPCAMTAVRDALNHLSLSACPSGITALQSCACTKDNLSAAIATTISKSVSLKCGSSATEDYASATQVFNQYCNPDAKVTAAAVNPTPVTVGITDMPNFSSLAPCAQSAVSYAVSSLTYSACPPGAAALQSCACTKGGIAAAVQKTISSTVALRCGATASEDFISASLMFSEYCNPGGKISSRALNKNALAIFITDLPAYSYLAPCAKSALSYAVQGMSSQKCPEGPSALNSCVCTKNQNSIAASSTVNSAVQYTCGRTHTADVSSAQAVLAGYCKLGAGVTSFPVPSSPVGKMTYYITDMPVYSSLAKCAQNAVHSAIGTLTSSLCPGEAGPLASCACIKDKNSLQVSKILTDSVRDECAETATEDVASAMGVYNAYCSAAKGLSTPTGIIASAPTSDYGSIPSPATGADITAPTPTATNSDGSSATTGAGGSSGDATNPDGTTKKKSNTGAIAGGVVGGLGAILIGAGALFFFLRRRKQQSVSNAPAYGPLPEDKPPASPGPQGPTGPTELAGKEDYRGVNNEMPGSSPGPLHSELAGSPHGPSSELAGSSHTPQHSELAGSPHGPSSELHSSPTQTHSELYGGSSPGGQTYTNSESPRSPYGSTVHEASAGQPRNGSVAGSVVSPLSVTGHGQSHEMNSYAMSATMNSPVYEMPTEYGRH
ncbi:hypothetical protein V494_02826 [Pseudogymnoascus sp. VKM F-4513 (FW-928)]|nr:hypothetical protein V494_02826 [Pseudogymnoascus sp. VKM F-4513 (FW-928)]